MSGQKKKKIRVQLSFNLMHRAMGLRAKEFPPTESDHFQIFKMLQSKTKCPLKKEKK